MSTSSFVALLNLTNPRSVTFLRRIVAQSDALSYVSVILDDFKALRYYSATVTAIDKDQDHSCVDVESQWQLPYHTLQILAKIFWMFPTFVNHLMSSRLVTTRVWLTNPHWPSWK